MTECGCKARSMQIGAVPVVLGPVAQGLATFGAMSNGHAVSRWAASRMPAARGTFGDPVGGRAEGHVSSGGRYHPSGSPAGRQSASIGGRTSGRTIARRAAHALPDVARARRIVHQWIDAEHPSEASIKECEDELRRLHVVEQLDGAQDWDTGQAPRPTVRSDGASAWRRARSVASSSSTATGLEIGDVKMLARDGLGGTRRGSAWARARRGVATSRATGGRSMRIGLGGELDDRINMLAASWDTLKIDISGSSVVDTAFRQAFLRDYAAWRQFVADHHGDWVVTRTSLDQAESYRHLLEHWRDAFTNAGGESTGQTTEPPPPGLLERAEEAAREPARAFASVSTAIAIAVGLVAIAWGLSSARAGAAMVRG